MIIQKYMKNYMTKISFDRLPPIVYNLYNIWGLEDWWNGLSPEKQKNELLDIHYKILNQSHQLLQLILEIEK